MEYMATVPDKYFDLAIVDPPYGIGADVGLGFSSIDKRDGKIIHRPSYSGKWDAARPNDIYFVELLRVSRNTIVWGGNYFADILPAATHWIFWDKHNPMPTFGDGELAYTTMPRKSVSRVSLTYWGHQTAGETIRIHPTQKPVALYKWLLKNYAKPEMKILDTHGGSFSSAIACYDFGTVEYVGCELDKDYFDVAVKRYNYHISQTNLFK
jgi:site-specific DNA-methyltransferase (adenine-specific)